jgi:copper chaperone CopZ
MRFISLIAALLLPLATACDKSESPAGQAAKAQGKTVEAKSAEATPAATKPAEEAKAEGECNPAEMEEGSCAQKGEGACNKWDEAADEVAKREVPADAEWTVMKVSGMHCGGCERRIIANVGSIDGVLAVEADAELGQVRVATAKGAKDIQKAATDKIGELGYKLQ